MRRLPGRIQLSKATLAKLAAKTSLLASLPKNERAQRARSMFDAARSTAWFSNVVTALRSISGVGELCMYCSANEPSQVEHYRPLATFPEQSMTYENYIWSCDICNRTYKGNKFPPDTMPGAEILNPIDDDVWDYFFLEPKFGRLLKLVDPHTEQPKLRAQSTCDVVGLDRETLQIRRQHRYRDLRNSAALLFAQLESGSVEVTDAQLQINEWLDTPFQADVANYFLKGPGTSIEPFNSLLAYCKLK